MTMSDFNPRPSDKLTANERKELDTSEFGIPQLREFPIHDAAHVRAAEAYFRYAPEEYKAQLARNILAKAHRAGSERKKPRHPGVGGEITGNKSNKAGARRKIPGLFPTFVPIYPLTL